MNRYNRQTLLPEIGEEGQQKIRQARVLLVGVGGLGSPIALYLTASGIGHLGLMDDDVVSTSNLGRQVLYREDEVGQPKVECAARHLRAQNKDVEIIPHAFRLTKENADNLIGSYDIVIDGCDNHATRYLISDTCQRLGKPYIYAAIGGFQGQVAILCHDEEACTYRTIYPDEQVTCTFQAGKGVLGTIPAIVGSMATNEALKLIVGCGQTLINRLWTIDLLNLQTYIIHLK